MHQHFECNFISIIFFIGTVSPDTVMMLTNALHFKGSWTVAFNEVPELMPFTLSNGAKVPAKMMTRKSYEIVLGSFKFEKVCPDIIMHLVTLSYLVSQIFDSEINHLRLPLEALCIVLSKLILLHCHCHRMSS